MSNNLVEPSQLTPTMEKNKKNDQGTEFLLNSTGSKKSESMLLTSNNLHHFKDSTNLSIDHYFSNNSKSIPNHYYNQTLDNTQELHSRNISQLFKSYDLLAEENNSLELRINKLEFEQLKLDEKITTLKQTFESESYVTKLSKIKEELIKAIKYHEKSFFSKSKLQLIFKKFKAFINFHTTKLSLL